MNKTKITNLSFIVLDTAFTNDMVSYSWQVWV